ncbi:hypothetical protein ANO14919_013400 [Xylariales sp. No.14919]|nr:hypothetical protein ANO14919_013400 [Xylariales sp. No.14919]
MNLSPLSSPMRRLPKPPAPLSRARDEDENSPPAADRGALKYPATLPPSRALPSNNRSSFLLSSATNEKTSHSVSPKSRKSDKPKRLSYQEPTSYSTQQGDVQSRARHSQEWNSYMEQFQCELSALDTASPTSAARAAPDPESKAATARPISAAFHPAL